MNHPDANQNLNLYEADLKQAFELYYNCKSEEAIEKFTDLLDQYFNLIPSDQKAKIYHAIGCAYSGLYKHESAINYFDKALEINPDNAQTWYQKGWSYNCMGWAEYDWEALECYGKALELDPSHQAAEDAQFNLMDLMREHGPSER